MLSSYLLVDFTVTVQSLLAVSLFHFANMEREGGILANDCACYQFRIPQKKLVEKVIEKAKGSTGVS